MASKIYDRPLQISLYFCGCPSSINRSNHLTQSIFTITKLLQLITNNKEIKSEQHEPTGYAHPAVEAEKYNRLQWGQSHMNLRIKRYGFHFLFRRMQNPTLLRIKITRPNRTILRLNKSQIITKCSQDAKREYACDLDQPQP